MEKFLVGFLAVGGLTLLILGVVLVVEKVRAYKLRKEVAKLEAASLEIERAIAEVEQERERRMDQIEIDANADRLEKELRDVGLM